MKNTQNHLISFFIISFVFFTNSVSAVSWFGGDEEIIWEGAANNYFKLAEQEDSKFGKNDHPISIDEEEIIDALTALEYTDTSILGSESIVSVYSYSQVRLLAEYISKGLSEAKATQDIIFAIGGSSRKLLVLTKKSYTTGRVFYKAGKLNIIIGEYDLVRSEAMEKELDPSGRGEVNYNFSHGYRDKKSNHFKDSIIGVTGVAQKVIKGEPRLDWIEIDIKLAAEAYVARKKERENPQLQGSQALKVEAAKLAKQRREMRAEMARLRKDVEQRNNESSSAKSIEERISTLDQLLEKELISKEEYAVKRKEILNDI
jgi:hypothetical protein